MIEELRPEDIQTLIALVFALASGFVTLLVGVVGLFIQARRQALTITKQEADAVDRERKSKENAEKIQQDAQKFVQQTADQLLQQIIEQGKRYDNLQDKYTTLISENATRSSLHTVTMSEFNQKYDDVLARITAALQKLHEAETQLKDEKNKKMELQKTVTDLSQQLKELETRIKALEADKQTEETLRKAAEVRANAAEERALAAENEVAELSKQKLPDNGVPAEGKIETKQLPTTV